MTNDEDLTAEDSFKLSFANVVNFFLFIYSLSLGVSFLIREWPTAAIINMAFSFLFVLHFVFTYLLKHSFTNELVNRTIIFLFFVQVFINSSLLGYSGMTIIMYPFIAIVMSGRRTGVGFSTLHLLIICLYCWIAPQVSPEIQSYSLLEIINIIIVQFASIFVYYVAIRWLSGMVYDKIHEVNGMNDEINVKNELISMLTSKLDSPIKDIDKAVSILSDERLTTTQLEMLSSIKASSQNVNEIIDSIRNAAIYSIRPVQREEKIFNIYALISSTLLLYGKRQHSVVMSSEVPQNVVGNSLLTRQIFLNIFDSLDRKLDLTNVPIKVNVALAEIAQGKIILDYIVNVDTDVKLDRRDLSSSQQRLVDSFELDNTRRMVLATKSEFSMSYESNSLQIEFTLPYKNVDLDMQQGQNSEATEISRPLMRNYISLDNASVLIVDDNLINQKIISIFIKDHVKKVSTASNGKEALDLFENSRFDIILMDLQMPEMDGFTATRKIREIESGFGKRIPIIAVTANAYDGNEERCREIGMDAYISKPFKADELLGLMEKSLKKY